MNREWIRKAGIQSLVKDLVAENSVSSLSNVSASKKVADWLESIGFEIEWVEYQDPLGVPKANLVAVRRPLHATLDIGGVGYLAHTDVVPVDDWNTGFNGPFEAVERNGRLYGRGTCDMKGSLCCAILAASQIEQASQQRPLFMVVTADEEVGMLGAQHVDQRSKLWKEMIQRDVVGIIGEPTEMQVVHGHKGTYGVILRANGQSAHTSTGRGINANYALIPALAPLLELRDETERLDEYRNTDYDPPTLTWNMVIKNEPLALNVTTATAEVQIFYRPMPGVDLSRIEKRLRQIQQDYGLEWIDRGEKPSWYVDSQAPWIRQMLYLTGQDQPMVPSCKT